MARCPVSPVLPREERDAIRARAEAATPGPWVVNVKERTVRSLADGYDGTEWGGTILYDDSCGERPIPGDAYFIAHARTDVPALLDALDAAEAENERLVDEVATAEILADSMQHFADVAERVESQNNALVAERDAARAEVAALRGRIEAVRALHHTVGQSQFCAGCYEGNKEDVWPCATYTALAADEGERTGR